MIFSIKFRPVDNDVNNNGERPGIIILADFQETFVASLIYWEVKDYENHWRTALERLVRGDDSCLITSLTDPKTANFLDWWPIYRNQEVAVFQNHLLFLDTLPRVFTPDNPYQFIPEHRTKTDEGGEISEWTVPVKDIEEFLAQP